MNAVLSVIVPPSTQWSVGMARVGEHDDLAALPRLHQCERLLEVFEGEAVGHDRCEVDGTRSDQAPHLEPCLPEPPSDDAVDGGSLEDDVVVDVEGERL